MGKSAFKAAKGQDGVAAWVSGTTYAANEIREKDLVFYKSNTQTAQSFIPSEWDVVGVKSAGNTNEVQLTDGIGGFISDSEFTWVPSIDTLTAGATNTSVSTGNHNFTFGYSNNILSGDTYMNFIAGNTNNIGRSRWGTWLGELNQAYGGGRKQNAFSIGLSNKHISSGTQFGGVAVGQYNIVSGNSTVSFALGFNNLVAGNFSLGTGFNAASKGRTSFVHADDKSSSSNAAVSERVLATGRHAINMSANDLNQTAGYGVLANWSAVFGGVNHHIDVGNTGTTIIGGNTIVLTGTSYIDNVVVPNLALWSTPSGGTGSDEVLVWDTIDKKVKKVSQASIGGATITASNGLTKVDTNITLGGTLTGDTLIDTNTFGVVVGTSGSTATGNNSFAQGFTSCAVGHYSSSFGKDTCASGVAAMVSGCDNFAIGDYSFAGGYGTCSRGLGSFAAGSGISGTKPVYAYGTASVNISNNTVSQTDGDGALAHNSAIIGGIDHNIESGNVRAAVIGGSTIKLTGTTYIDTTAVGNLAIFETPQTGTNEDVLVWDEANKLIKKVDQISISSGAFWNTSGTTNVKDTINILDSNTLEFTFDGSAGSTNSLTYNPAASANQGEIIISTQNSAANRTTTVSVNAQDGFDVTTVGSTPINIGTDYMTFNFGTTNTVFTDLRSAGSQRGILYGGLASYDDLIDDSLITKGFGDARYLTGVTSVGGSISIDQVAVGSGTDTISGSTGFTWTGGNKTLTIAGSTPTLLLKPTTGDDYSIDNSGTQFQILNVTDSDNILYVDGITNKIAIGMVATSVSQITMGSDVTGQVLRVRTTAGHSDSGAVFDVEDATITAMPSGCALGSLLFRGSYNASTQGTGASFKAVATELWDASGFGTEFRISTVANNTTTNTERFVITHDGHVEINTTPAAGGADDVLTWDSSGKTIRKVTQASLSGSSSSKWTDVGSGNIYRNSKVHIGGTADPTMSLKVSSAVDLALFIDHTSGTGSPSISFAQNGGATRASLGFRDSQNNAYFAGGTGQGIEFNTSTTTTLMEILSGGTVQIGTTDTTAGYLLNVTGSKGRATDWTATSDRDLKKCITTCTNVLPQLDKMDGFLSTYIRKDDPLEQTELGMIAQDVQEVFPELIGGDKSKGEDLDISYMRLGAISIQGIVELHKKIKELEITVNELKEQLNK